jgi:hypothetical protein
VVLGGLAAARFADSGEAGGGAGRGWVGEGSRGHMRSIWVLVWGQAAPEKGYRDTAVHWPLRVGAPVRWWPGRATSGCRSSKRS